VLLTLPQKGNPGHAGEGQKQIPDAGLHWKSPVHSDVQSVDPPQPFVAVAHCG
jgi:hypothetical protein